MMDPEVEKVPKVMIVPAVIVPKVMLMPKVKMVPGLMVPNVYIDGTNLE